MVSLWKLRESDKFTGMVFHYEDERQNLIPGEYPSDFSERNTTSFILDIAQDDELETIDGLFNNDHLTYIELKTKKGKLKRLG